MAKVDEQEPEGGGFDARTAREEVQLKKNHKRLGGFMAAVVALLFAGAAGAEDIDIYSGIAGGISNVPNLMFVIDSSSNSDASFGSSPCTYFDNTSPSMSGSKALGNEQCALANVVNSLPTSSVTTGQAIINLGITTATGHLIDLTPIDDKPFAYQGSYPSGMPTGLTNRQAFIWAVRSGYSKNTGQTDQGQEMQETWAYYTGGNGGKSSGATSGTLNNKGSISGQTFSQNGILNSSCAHNYIAFLGVSDSSAHTAAANDGASPLDIATAINNDVANNIIKSATATTLKTQFSSTINPQSPWAMEWARYAYQVDRNSAASGTQSIVTYGVILNGKNPTASMTTYWSNMAKYGGGKSLQANDYTSLFNSLLQILNEVQSVNSVFASSSLPVSVNSQGTYLNQIYVGMFRPDASANPRWIGNLKQYQFQLDSSGSLYLADSTGQAALSSSGTGFFSPNAISFWTSKTQLDSTTPTSGFWQNYPSMATSAGAGYDSPDGEWVEKGGSAQQIRIANLKDDYTNYPSSPRNLYTYCVSGTSCSTDLTVSSNAFATSNAPLVSAMGGTTSTPTGSTLIRWVRGEDNAADETGPGSPVTVRPSVHGDVLHSRPTVINYGTGGIVVFYGDNGGFFHAINGLESGSIGTTPPGGELWGFIPSELLPKLARQRSNSPALYTPSTPTGITPAPTRKDYFVDGTTGVYQTTDSTGTTQKAIIYLSMRRGGNFLYAIDVTTPSTPKFLWKVTTTSTGMSELGQTWSQPKVANVHGWANPVLIFGGGYDANEDTDPPTTADASGRAIFVLDAITGQLIWRATPQTSGTTSTYSGTASTTGNAYASAAVAGMNYSIPADITLIDRDRDGYIDRLYAADTGGNVWRVDLEPGGHAVGNDHSAPQNWRVYQLAALGCYSGTCAASSSSTTSAPRKFFFPPEVITTKTYDAVIAGSGDREHPLYINSNSQRDNRLFFLKDPNIGNDASSWNGPITLPGSTTKTLFDATSTPWDGTLNGYFITLAAGEKVVNAPLTAAGYVYFGTNQPTSAAGNSCIANLGIAKGYQLSPFSSVIGAVTFKGGGLPPSPVAGLVNIIVGSNGQSKTTPFLIGGGNANGSCVGSDCTSALGGQKPPLAVGSRRYRTYKYSEGK